MFKVLVSFTCFEGNGVWLAINSWQIPQQYKLFSRNLSWKWFLLRIIELIFERVKWFFAMIFGLTCSSPHAGSITTGWTVKFGVVCTSLHPFYLRNCQQHHEIPSPGISISFSGQWVEILLCSWTIFYPCRSPLFFCNIH